MNNYQGMNKRRSLSANSDRLSRSDAKPWYDLSILSDNQTTDLRRRNLSAEIDKNILEETSESDQEINVRKKKVLLRANRESESNVFLNALNYSDVHSGTNTVEEDSYSKNLHSKKISPEKSQEQEEDEDSVAFNIPIKLRGKFLRRKEHEMSSKNIFQEKLNNTDTSNDFETSHKSAQQRLNAKNKNSNESHTDLNLPNRSSSAAKRSVANKTSVPSVNETLHNNSREIQVPGKSHNIPVKLRGKSLRRKEHEMSSKNIFQEELNDTDTSNDFETSRKSGQQRSSVKSKNSNESHTDDLNLTSRSPSTAKRSMANRTSVPSVNEKIRNSSRKNEVAGKSYTDDLDVPSSSLSLAKRLRANKMSVPSVSETIHNSDGDSKVADKRHNIPIKLRGKSLRRKEHEERNGKNISREELNNPGTSNDFETSHKSGQQRSSIKNKNSSESYTCNMNLPRSSTAKRSMANRASVPSDSESEDAGKILQRRSRPLRRHLPEDEQNYFENVFTENSSSGKAKRDLTQKLNNAHDVEPRMLRISSSTSSDISVGSPKTCDADNRAVPVGTTSPRAKFFKASKARTSSIGSVSTSVKASNKGNINKANAVNKQLRAKRDLTQELVTHDVEPQMPRISSPTSQNVPVGSSKSHVADNRRPTAISTSPRAKFFKALKTRASSPRSPSQRSTPVKASGKDSINKANATNKTIDNFFMMKRSSTGKRQTTPNKQHSALSDVFKDAEKMRQIKKRIEALKSREMAAMKRQADNAEKKKLASKAASRGAAKKTKSSVDPARVNPAYLVNGKLYKVPRLPRPKSWVTDRLYKFLWKCMEPKYKMSTRVRSEKFIIEFSNIVTLITRRKKYENYKAELEALMNEMARLQIISTRNDFYHFCHEYMPYEFRVKVIPMLLPGNEQTIPHDPAQLYTPLLGEEG